MRKDIQETAQPSVSKARREAFDRSDCTNGPDEYGNWPCDPRVLYGDDQAECQTCGRVAAWKEMECGARYVFRVAGEEDPRVYYCSQPSGHSGAHVERELMWPAASSEEGDV